jgi:site-specific DNA recombinase
MITAEIKNKYIKSTGETRQYVYYRCTKRKKDTLCNQKPTRVEKLEEQISKILTNLEIIPEFKQWAIQVLKDNYKEEVDKQVQIVESINRTLSAEERKLKNLTDLLLDELISKDEFLTKKTDIKHTIERLKEKRDNIDME